MTDLWFTATLVSGAGERTLRVLRIGAVERDTPGVVLREADQGLHQSSAPRTIQNVTVQNGILAQFSLCPCRFRPRAYEAQQECKSPAKSNTTLTWSSVQLEIAVAATKPLALTKIAKPHSAFLERFMQTRLHLIAQVADDANGKATPHFKLVERASVAQFRKHRRRYPTVGVSSRPEGSGALLDHPLAIIYHARGARALCSGKTLAFQANDAGSIPAARSKPFPCAALST